LLDNGLQKLYTINKKGTVCEWSASFRHEIKKNDRSLSGLGRSFLFAVKNGPGDLKQRRPPPAADAGRSCWGSGQQDMSASQGAKWPLGAATRVLLEYHISRTNTTPRLPAGRGVRLVYRNFSCYT
jgi:hypothetical protein